MRASLLPRLTASLFAIGSATSGCAASATDEVAQAPSSTERIAFRSGPHWRAAFVNEVAERYACPGIVGLTAVFGFARPVNGRLHSRRRTLISLAYDGQSVGAPTIAAVNEAMRTFASEPRFTLL
ncbi:MAG TPA: hypothetical protein VEW25_02480, partial [Allosphingosinicella sp.]|nr:hypothetical protein [Allosphingosinicella sp.]